MADWKKSLRKAADLLGLKAKVGGKISEHPTTPVVNPPAGDDSRAVPGKVQMPVVGRPSPFGASLASSTPVEKPAQLPSPRPYPKPRTKPLPPPLTNVSQSFTASLSRLSLSVNKVERSITPPKAFAAPRFMKPDMTEYSICHGSAEASSDQSWQEIGTASNLARFEDRGRTQCTVGLDFGTAFTKACVQCRGSTFVVHWDRAVPSCRPFLLPSVFTVLREGECALGACSEGSIQGDLKMALLSGAHGEHRTRATAFLALVTRHIRWWLFAQHANVFRGFQLEWFVNIGLPAVPWDDQDVRAIYRSIALAGWRLGCAAGPITLARAASFLTNAQENTPAAPEQLPAGRIVAFPEFVAQINSYRKSPQRRRDLHLLVDVGAGTVDIVTFHVWEPEETDCYSILEASVEPAGTHMLLGHRAQSCNLRRSRWNDSDSSLQMQQFESKFGLSPGSLRPAQDLFADNLSLSLKKLLGLTKHYRYEASPAWKEGVPFFLSGGGRDVDAYREAIAAVQKNTRLVEMVLPWPRALVAGRLGREDFHRLSVAHGLSYSAENLGAVERRSEVPDSRRHQSFRSDYRSLYIEK